MAVSVQAVGCENKSISDINNIVINHCKFTKHIRVRTCVPYKHENTFGIS